MKKKTVVFISLLLALSLAACSIPLRDQTDPASTEAGGSAKVSEEEKTSPHNTMADTKGSSSSESSRAQAESSPTTAVEPASSTADIRQKLLSADIGSYVTFGSYEQDGNTANGKEEIEWLILDRDRSGKSVLLISKLALFVPQWSIYYADYDSIIDRHSVKTGEGDRWVWTDANARIEGTRQCVDRFYDWLKDETDSFYINAFSSEEKEQLVQDASQITVLTSAEVSLFRNESQKRVPATKYAIQEGAYNDSTNGNTAWLLLKETDPDIGAAKVYEANETEDFNIGILFSAISPRDPQSGALGLLWEQTCLRPVIRMELETETTQPASPVESLPYQTAEADPPAAEDPIEPVAMRIYNDHQHRMGAYNGKMYGFYNDSGEIGIARFDRTGNIIEEKLLTDNRLSAAHSKNHTLFVRGGKIYFQETLNGKEAFYVMGIDGSDLHRIGDFIGLDRIISMDEKTMLTSRGMLLDLQGNELADTIDEACIKLGIDRSGKEEWNGQLFDGYKMIYLQYYSRERSAYVSKLILEKYDPAAKNLYTEGVIDLTEAMPESNIHLGGFYDQMLFDGKYVYFFVDLQDKSNRSSGGLYRASFATGVVEKLSDKLRSRQKEGWIANGSVFFNVENEGLYEIRCDGTNEHLIQTDLIGKEGLSISFISPEGIYTMGSFVSHDLTWKARVPSQIQ